MSFKNKSKIIFSIVALMGLAACGSSSSDADSASNSQGDTNSVTTTPGSESVASAITDSTTTAPITNSTVTTPVTDTVSVTTVSTDSTTTVSTGSTTTVSTSIPDGLITAWPQDLAEAMNEFFGELLPLAPLTNEMFYEIDDEYQEVYMEDLAPNAIVAYGEALVNAGYVLDDSGSDTDEEWGNYDYEIYAKLIGTNTYLCVELDQWEDDYLSIIGYIFVDDGEDEESMFVDFSGVAKDEDLSNTVMSGWTIKASKFSYLGAVKLQYADNHIISPEITKTGAIDVSLNIFATGDGKQGGTWEFKILGLNASGATVETKTIAFDELPNTQANAAVKTWTLSNAGDNIKSIKIVYTQKLTGSNIGIIDAEIA